MVNKDYHGGNFARRIQYSTEFICGRQRRTWWQGDNRQVRPVHARKNAEYRIVVDQTAAAVFVAGIWGRRSVSTIRGLRLGEVRLAVEVRGN